MSPPPYMKFYVADHLSDTFHLTTLEQGAYLLLLFHMWRRGGKLPAADKELAIMARCDSDEWARIRANILPLFKRSRGHLTHNRVEQELAQFERTSHERSIAGKRGAAEKAKKNKYYSKANASGADKQLLSYSDSEQIYPPTPPPRGAETTDRGREAEAGPPAAARRDAAFQRAFDAFPIAGRSSSSFDRSRSAFMALVDTGDPAIRDDPDALADAAEAYAAWVAADASHARRVPAFHAWLQRGNYQAFLAIVRAKEPPCWPGPDDIKAAIEDRCGEGWARYSLAACRWRDLPTPAVVCRSRLTRDRVLEKIGDLLAERGVAVVLEATA